MAGAVVVVVACRSSSSLTMGHGVDVLVASSTWRSLSLSWLHRCGVVVLSLSSWRRYHRVVVVFVSSLTWHPRRCGVVVVGVVNVGGAPLPVVGRRCFVLAAMLCSVVAARRLVLRWWSHSWCSVP